MEAQNATLQRIRDPATAARDAAHLSTLSEIALQVSGGDSLSATLRS